ncbi:MAG: hypothetical protein QXT77_06145 [Candidatus Methanomethylicaceae archaeon]
MACPIELPGSERSQVLILRGVPSWAIPLQVSMGPSSHATAAPTHPFQALAASLDTVTFVHALQNGRRNHSTFRRKFLTSTTGRFGDRTACPLPPQQPIFTGMTSRQTSGSWPVLSDRTGSYRTINPAIVSIADRCCFDRRRER